MASSHAWTKPITHPRGILLCFTCSSSLEASCYKCSLKFQSTWQDDDIKLLFRYLIKGSICHELYVSRAEDDVVFGSLAHRGDHDVNLLAESELPVTNLCRHRARLDDPPCLDGGHRRKSRPPSPPNRLPRARGREDCDHHAKTSCSVTALTLLDRRVAKMLWDLETRLSGGLFPSGETSKVLECLTSTQRGGQLFTLKK